MEILSKLIIAKTYLIYAKHYSKHYIYQFFSYLQKPFEVDVLITPAIQIKTVSTGRQSNLPRYLNTQTAKSAPEHPALLSLEVTDISKSHYKELGKFPVNILSEFCKQIYVKGYIYIYFLNKKWS